MKKLLAGLLVILFVGSVSLSSRAEQEKGWHKGTYFLVGLGMMNNDEDTNVLTNTAFGSTNLLGYGYTIGWNFIDWLALELQMRYATETAAGQREHAANIDILAKYSLILNGLTKWEKIQFLPYIKGGAGIYGAAVPRGANDRFGVYGPAGVLAVGMETLLLKKFYVGADFANHFVNLQAKNNAAGQRILNGGFDYQYSIFGYFGIHF